jgi:hypothetical protein
MHPLFWMLISRRRRLPERGEVSCVGSKRLIPSLPVHGHAFPPQVAGGMRGDSDRSRFAKILASTKPVGTFLTKLTFSDLLVPQ